MEAKTIEALHKSIAHWNDICYGIDNSIGSKHCSLCVEFAEGKSLHFNCGDNTDCPIRIKTGVPECRRTSYQEYVRLSDEHKHNCTAASADAAEAMLETLVGLLPEREADIYFAETEGSTYQWSTKYMHDGLYIMHGITTDARNAFPNAKEVWAKIFNSKTEKGMKKANGFREGDIVNTTSSYNRIMPNSVRGVVVGVEERAPDATPLLKLVTKDLEIVHIDSGWFVEDSPVPTQELTVAEISEKLGYPVKIVRE
jgi:hypothetical protein